MSHSFYVSAEPSHFPPPHSPLLPNPCYSVVVCLGITASTTISRAESFLFSGRSWPLCHVYIFFCGSSFKEHEKVLLVWHRYFMALSVYMVYMVYVVYMVYMAVWGHWARALATAENTLSSLVVFLFHRSFLHPFVCFSVCKPAWARHETWKCISYLPLLICLHVTSWSKRFIVVCVFTCIYVVPSLRLHLMPTLTKVYVRASVCVYIYKSFIPFGGGERHHINYYFSIIIKNIA